MGFGIKIPKGLKVLVENSHRWAGAVSGPPGSGKTTFIKAIVKMSHKPVIVVSVKEKQSVEHVDIPEDVVINGISRALHFTAIGLRPSFDVLSVHSPKSLEDLENIASKFKIDIAEWVLARLRVIKQWLVEENGRRYVRVPLYLRDYDELERRLTVGLLYAARPHLPYIFVFDDSMAFVLNESYKEAALAMLRPYLISVNRYLDGRELLLHNPVIITPGGSGVCVAA